MHSGDLHACAFSVQSMQYCSERCVTDGIVVCGECVVVDCVEVTAAKADVYTGSVRAEGVLDG